MSIHDAHRWAGASAGVTLTLSTIYLIDDEYSIIFPIIVASFIATQIFLEKASKR